jgi:cyclopropane-fatty-acyl-phospholipid synthase
MASLITMAEHGLIPDGLLRLGIKFLVGQRLRSERRHHESVANDRLRELTQSRVALHTGVANEQHYEIPTAFFEKVLGPRLKYSASIYPSSSATLAQAEDHTLELYRERLDVRPGDQVLDLGCGWGSFSLWLAQIEPTVNIVAVSNSQTQREFIQQRAQALGLSNIEVITRDVNELDLPTAHFDKVISVEMFEHVRNYQELLGRISGWLKPQGALFVHIFCHKELLYPFETQGEANWMGRYFFTGGLMPAATTLEHFQDDLGLTQTWLHDGRHYERTARAWLDNMDARQAEVIDCLSDAYPASELDVWVQRWRMFFMACEEMFAYDHGNQWQVAHYRFVNK